MMKCNKQELMQIIQKVMDCESDEDTIDNLIEILINHFN